MLSQIFKSMTSSIMGLVSSVVDMASHFEQTEKGLETVLQSAEKGQQLFEDLRKFSFDTTFGVDELASASSQLLNAGTSAKNLQKQLKMLGDVAQGDKQKFAELTSIFSKIELQGKASAMALSQFNFRGVPLAKTLKEMGVVGTASFEQVREALEKLTDEGGQFHNAMDNIIDTIEGKRGFIEDTQKEILVNFGEATGLTSAFKTGLDLVYAIFEKINNLLMAINENPIMKALMTGLFVTAIMSIVTVIASSLIPKLIAVIAKLVTINALKGPLGWVSLIAGGVTAGISALISLGEEEEDYADKVRETNAELEEQIRLNNILKGIGEEGVKVEIDVETSLIENYKESIENVQKEIQDALAQKRLKLTTSSASEFTLASLDDKSANVMAWAVRNGLEQEYLYDELLDMYEKELDYQINVVDADSMQNQLIDDKLEKLNKELEINKQLLDSAEKYSNAYKIINEYIDDTGNTQLNKLKKDLEELTAMYSEHKFEEATNIIYTASGARKTEKVRADKGLLIDLDPNFKVKLDKATAKLREEIANIEISLNLADWQKALQKAFGFTDTQVRNGAVAKGSTAVDKFIKETDAKFGRMKSMADVLGLDELDIAKQKVDYITKAIQTIIESKNEKGEYLWGIDEGTIKLLEAYLKLAKEGVSLPKEEKNGSFADTDLVGQLTDSIKSSIEEAFKNSESLVKGLSNGVKGFTANVNMASFGVGMLLEAIQQFANSIQNKMKEYDESGIVTNPFDAVVDKLSGVIQSFVEFQEAMNNTLNDIAPLLELIGSIFRVIGKFGELFVKLSRMLSTPLIVLVKLFGKLADGINDFADWLDKLFDGWFDWLDSSNELADAQEEEAERLRRLNEQYSALYSAMKEQEEYYIRTKIGLNAESYKNNVTKVNDMILTPKGTFSTSPQDTILAMKHPEDLGSGKAPVINIYNESNATVTTETRQDGGVDIRILSKAIASDFASGNNGWDMAYESRTIRQQGRAYSL